MNYFHLFDRVGYQYVGSFQGPVTMNTDGVGHTPTARFPRGAFYAIHNDGNVSVFSLEEIAEVLDFS